MQRDQHDTPTRPAAHLPAVQVEGVRDVRGGVKTPRKLTVDGDRLAPGEQLQQVVGAVEDRHGLACADARRFVACADSRSITCSPGLGVRRIAGRPTWTSAAR